MPNIPEKRKNPFEKTLSAMREEQSKKEEAKVETKAEEKTLVKTTKENSEKKPTKASTEKKATKKASEKKTTKASTEKKASSKKTTTKKTTKKAAAKPAKVKIDAKTGVAKVVAPKTKKATTTKTTKADVKKAPAKTPKKATVKKEPEVIIETTPEVVETTPVIVETPVIEIPVQAPQVEETPQVEVPVKKPRKISKRAQLLKEQKAAERAAAKAAKMMPVEIIRPVPKKFKLATKEEKAQFKKLEESFDYLVNLASVVEEKTMDKDEITDITLGELHVIQMVKKFNNKPMTLIANNLKVTVGSLITCLNRLIQKDYIIRTRDEMDNRVILLSITPKAQKVLKAHDKFHDDILGLLLENGVTLPQATKVLSTLNTVLEVYYDPIHNSFTKEEKGSKAKKK